MKKNITILLFTIVLAMSLVMAGDFNINYAGGKIFTVATNGTTSIGNLTVSDWITTAGNITVEAGSFFVGSGQFLTDVSFEENSSKLDYHNITSIPTCTGTFLTFDGTDLSCAAISHGAVTIDGANITSGTIGLAYLPNMTGGSFLSWRNITNIPGCTGDQRLTFSGTELTCNDTSIGDGGILIDAANITSGTISTARMPSNLAYLNVSQVWTADQNFSGSINVSKSLTLESNDSVITRSGVLTNITIDSLGNININLG